MRDRRLLQLKRLGEITDRAGCFSEAGKNPNAAAGRKRLHRLRHLPGGLAVEEPDRRVSLNTVSHIQDYMHNRSYDPLQPRICPVIV